MINKRREDLFFIIVLSLIIGGVLIWFPINHLLLHFGYKELQTTDNWVYFEATKDGLLGKLDDFIESNKNNIQNRVTNYFPFYQELTKFYYKDIINTNKLIYKDVFPIGLNSSGEYVFYNDKEDFYYLINNHSKDDLDKRVNSQIGFFNSLYESNSDVNLNVYIIPRYEQTKILDNNLSKYTTKFKNGLNKNIKVSELNINNIDTYLNMFYKTDHHWNMYGAYIGYQDIMKMLNKESLDLKIKKVNKKPYYGSMAKSSLSTLVYDDIYDVDVDLKYEVTTNGEVPETKFKPRSMRYEKEYQFFDYYIHYFDGQYGLVEYNFNNESDENLLIFSDSYAWQIDYLIASHYKNTYIINLRYDDYANGKFYYNDFIKNKNISDVLFLYEGSSTIFDQYDYNFEKKIVRD